MISRTINTKQVRSLSSNTNRSIFLIISIFVSVTAFGQDRFKAIDWGIKGGVNSDICIIDELSIAENAIDYTENTYRVGISGDVFIRLNIDKMYIQLEPGYNFSRGGLEFSFTDEDGAKNPIGLSWEFNSLSAPLLLGYHLIKEPPYGLNFFVGPKIATIFKSKNNFTISTTNYPLDFDFKRFNFGAVCGIGLNISGLFFDFRYEFGITHILNDITYSIPIETEDPFGKIVLKNRMNSISFSVGYIF